MHKIFKPIVFYAALAASYLLLLVISQFDVAPSRDGVVHATVFEMSTFIPMIHQLPARYAYPETGRLLLAVAWVLAAILGVILFAMDDSEWLARSKARWSGFGSKDKRLLRLLVSQIFIIGYLYFVVFAMGSEQTHAIRLMLSGPFQFAFLSGTCIFAVPIFLKSFSLALRANKDVETSGEA